MPPVGYGQAVSAIWDRLDSLLDLYDADFKAAACSGSAWGGRLRLTLTNPDGAPSRSMTFYSVGKADPEGVAIAVLDDARLWMRESGITPLPLPSWLR